MNIKHVERLNTIEKLETEGFEGLDASLAISLFEYGLAWLEMEAETLFVYGIRYDGQYSRFDRCTLSNDVNVLTEYDWGDMEEVAKTCGMELGEWLDLPLPTKISDLVHHYGYENVFGSSYWEGVGITEVTEVEA